MTKDGRDSQDDPGSTSLGRGLAILRAMNTTPIYASLRQLHEITGLPKPSIIRLLERFIAEGLVARTNKRGSYRLTSAMTDLARGWDPVWAAVDVVERRPMLLSHYKWPVAIGTRNGAELLVLFSTRRTENPYSFRPSTFGVPAPLLTSAMGAAYLAHCDDAERRRAATDLCGSASTPGAMLEEINRVATETRDRGYGLRLGRKGQDTSVAVPIFGVGGALVGVICETGFAAATSASDIKSFARALVTTAGLIEEEICRNEAHAPSRPDTGVPQDGRA